jgi:hypothetical protein
MQIRDHLSKEQKQQLNQLTSSPVKKKKRKRKKKENLSFHDWEDIMGVNRDTYTRRNGAIRRK